MNLDALERLARDALAHEATVAMTSGRKGPSQAAVSLVIPIRSATSARNNPRFVKLGNIQGEFVADVPGGPFGSRLAAFDARKLLRAIASWREEEKALARFAELHERDS